MKLSNVFIALVAGLSLTAPLAAETQTSSAVLLRPFVENVRPNHELTIYEMQSGPDVSGAFCLPFVDHVRTRFGESESASVRRARRPGRTVADHGPYGFTNWFAGGGVKGGTVYGSTDEIGYVSVANRVSIQDWYATILHQLGLDIEWLNVDRNRLDERLSRQFESRVVREIPA